MMMRILIPVLAMAGLGLVFGIGLAYALKIFGIDADPAIFKILSFLPGSNCGVCGKAGCAGFAEALKRGEALPAGCAVANEEARKAIAELLGLPHTAKVKTVAAVLCNGGIHAADKYEYRGIRTCSAASLVFGGQKACAFGCVGFGDCAKVCPFGAITMGADELPVVDPDKCTACGNCVRACPKLFYNLNMRRLLLHMPIVLLRVKYHLFNTFMMMQMCRVRSSFTHRLRLAARYVAMLFS